MLIILGGLPGTGKSTIARELARQTGAVHVRVDSIEQAMRASWPLDQPINEAGYRVAYAVAGDNLRAGNVVIADSVNPIAITRESWRAVAQRAGELSLEVEVVCTEAEEHRRRVETRQSDVEGLELPSWQDVQDREYETWAEERLVLNTAQLSAAECVAAIIEAIGLIRRSLNSNPSDTTYT